MGKKSKILLIIILLISGLSVLFFRNRVVLKNKQPIAKQVGQQQDDVQPEISSEPAPNNTPANNNQEENADQSDTENQAADSNTSDSNVDVANESNNFLDILPSDCKNNCKEFDQPEDLKYCREYCGLNTIAKDQQKQGCDKFEDLDKDYCLKNEAIAKKDSATCDQIADDGIRKACHNRLTEDILDTPSAQ